MENSVKKSEKRVNFFEKNKRYPFFLLSAGESDYEYIYNNVEKDLDKCYLIGYVLSGNGILSQKDISYTLKDNDIFILSPDNEEGVFSNPEIPLRLLWFAFSGRVADFLFENYDLEKQSYFSGIDILNNMEEILNLSNSKENDEIIMSKVSVQFMEILQKLYIYNVETRLQSSPITTAEKMKQIIDAMDGYDLSMTELAEKVFCSRNHAIRLFRNNFGVSPYKYISDLRLKRAKKMLKNSNMPIGEIASNLDFCDSRYFSNWFKTHEKISPKEYRLKKTKKSE